MSEQTTSPRQDRGTLHSLPGPHDVLRRTLPNGITVLARENWSAPSVVLEGYIQVGSVDEPAELTGLASFTAGMLGRGTRRRSFSEINELVESVGASLGFSVNSQITDFSAKSLTEDLDLILEVLADELRGPIFPGEHVERLRGLRMTAIAERENDTRQMVSQTFRELMYEDHPLGRDLLGSRRSNTEISRDALTAFHGTHYCPSGMVVCIVGAVAAEVAFQKVVATFGDWTGERPARPGLPPLPGLDSRRERRVSMPDKSQTDVTIGWPAMRRLDADFEPARLANTVLGVFGMMGRLGEAVRENQGMAYYAYSRLRANREPGTWAAVAGVAPDNVDRAIQAILAEIERLRDEPVSEDELLDSKSYLTGSLPLQLETNDGVAGILVDLEWHQLGLDYLHRYPDIINGLKVEDVQSAARKYLNPDAYVLAIAGP